MNVGEIISGQEFFCRISKAKSVKASLWQQVYSRTYLKDIGLRFTVGYIAEDAFFSLKALVLAPKVSYVKQTFYVYQISDNSTYKYIKGRDYFKGLFICYCDIWQFWQSQQWSREVSEYLVSYMMTRYRFAQRNYNPKIHKEIDQWIEEQNETVKSLYYVFKEQNQGYYVKEINDEQRSRIEEAESIYVFGAGRVAEEVAAILQQMNKVILAYIVSDHTSKNPKAVYGVPVVRIGDLKCINKDALVIIAAVPRYNAGIMKTLKEYGFTDNILKIVG